MLLLVTILSGLLCTAIRAQSSIAAIDVNVANVPDCAKVCLSNSTQYATDCAQIDVKCLCNSPSYVSALSCCLATNCNPTDQQTAIQFNIQECAAVNSTAPNFVGCSPFSLTTGGANKQSTSTSSGSNTDSIGATTISGVATVPTGFTNTRLGTAKYNGAALLTGSCSVPMFAEVTNTVGQIIQFPQVGCALDRADCCPFEPDQYAGVTRCPADYTTTAGACCPSGYSVYYSAMGAVTPCFSKPTKAYLPAATVTGSQVIVVTDAVFSRKYTLIGSRSKDLSSSAIAGIVVGSFVAAVGIPGLIIMLLRRKRRVQEKPVAQTENMNLTYPSTDPALNSQQHMSEVPTSRAMNSVQELASPETGANTPATIKGYPFPSPSVAPALLTYEVPDSSISHSPAEMPGSTYLHEHHPANATSQPDAPPQVPPRSPSGTMSTRSPVLSPASPYRTDSPSNIGNITPLGSPSLRASPRFREGTM